MSNRNRFTTSLAGLLLGIFFTVAALVGVNQIAPAQAQYSVPCYVEPGGAKRVAASGCTYEFQSGSTLDLQEGGTIDGFVSLTAQSTISVTDSSVLTPTGSYQPIQSGGAVTATLSSGCTAGQLVNIVNLVAQDIVISETATSALSGNATLNQYDSLQLICDGTRWVELAQANN